MMLLFLEIPKMDYGSIRTPANNDVIQAVANAAARVNPSVNAADIIAQSYAVRDGTDGHYLALMTAQAPWPAILLRHGLLRCRKVVPIITGQGWLMSTRQAVHAPLSRPSSTGCPVHRKKLYTGKGISSFMKSNAVFSISEGMIKFLQVSGTQIKEVSAVNIINTAGQVRCPDQPNVNRLHKKAKIKFH